MDLRRLQELAGITEGRYLHEQMPGYYDEEEHSHLPPASGLAQLRPQLAKAAQAVYDQWQQDETGYCDIQGHSGGICHTIADGFLEVLWEAGYEDATSFNPHMGENHVWAIVNTSDGVYEVDIPPGVYEVGGGYSWTKIPDVTFEPGDVHIGMVSPDPGDFQQYLEDY